jgi:integrase/recombinase XerD
VGMSFQGGKAGKKMLKIIDDYFKYIKEYGYSKKTIRDKVYAVKKLIGFMEKEGINDFNNINHLSKEAFEIYLNQINCGKIIIKSYIKRTREFFNYLVIKNIIKTNPFVMPKRDPCYPEELKRYSDEYIKIKKNELSSFHSLARIKSSIKILLAYLTGIEVKRFNEIKKNDIKSFISGMIDKKDKSGNNIYKAVSINRILFDVRSFFLFLKDRNICPDVLSVIVNLRQAEKVSRNILTKKEIADFLKAEPDDLYQFMMKTIFTCLYSTGVRISELLNLKITDIDYENKVLTIYETKTKKERCVHIGDVGLNYLKIYLMLVRDKISYAPDKSSLVFMSNTENSKISRSTINKYLKIFCKKTGVTKNVSVHSFRHSYGTHMLENGADIKIISELLGHSQLSSTERYTRLGVESLREIINRFHPREQEENKWN